MDKRASTGMISTKAPFNFLFIFVLAIQNLLVMGDNLTVGFLPALTNNKGRADSKYFVGAFLCALHDINNSPYILPNRTLSYFFNDTRANTITALRGMTSQYMAGALAVIGPEGTCLTEAKLAVAWNIPLIAYKCRDSEVSNNDLYPTFARTVPSTSKVSKSVISVMQKFQWTRFAIVAGNGPTWREAAKTLRKLADENGIYTSHIMSYEEPYIPNSGGERLHQIMRETHKETRIYAFLGEQYALMDFARYLHLDQLSTTGKYVVIAVHDKPYSTKERHKSFMKYFEDETFETYMVDAFKSVLTVSLRPPCNPDYEQFLDRTRNYSYGEPFLSPIPVIPGLKMDVTITGAYLYDAVTVYAKALDKVLQMGGDPRNGTLLMSYVKGHPFTSVQGYDMFIDKDGDVEGNYTLLSLQNDPMEFKTGKSLQPVGYFTIVNKDIPVLELHREIKWILGDPPPSEPRCGFDGSKCKFKPDWQTALICVIIVSLVIVTAVFLLRHYLYEQKLSSLIWKIDYRDLIMTDSNQEQVETVIGGERRMSFYQSMYTDDTKDFSLFNASPFTPSLKVASYKGGLVRVRMLRKRHVDVTRSLRKDLHTMKEMHHDNINRFIGACLDVPNMCIVTQYCQRGSLKDILENDDLHLDDMFIASLVSDLLKGMIYLHDSEIGFHGNLKSTNCLVDSRWVLQISDFGLQQLRYPSVYINEVAEKCYEKLLWTAPEVLRHYNKTAKCDVYSFGIILYEIHGRNGPWGEVCLIPAEIVERVMRPQPSENLYRPDLTQLTCGEYIKSCIKDCWNEDMDQRPDFKSIRIRLKPMQKGLKPNIFDNMLAMMEKYATNLEAIVEERTVQLMEEKKKTEALLLRMLPRSVADQLIKGNPVIPEQYDCVTIYFSDIVGFTQLAAQIRPMEVVDVLNDLYTLFDSIISAYDVYKVETIGDAYMVVSGLPIRNGDNHAGEICSMSLHLLSAIKTFKMRNQTVCNETLQLRIGVHSGPVCAGVVGLTMPRYCLFGDTVNTASRMESNGKPLRTHCSKECKQLLDKLGGYELEERGLVSMKGKGELLTYFLLKENKSHRIARLRLSNQGCVNGIKFPDILDTSGDIPHIKVEGQTRGSPRVNGLAFSRSSMRRTLKGSRSYNI